MTQSDSGGDFKTMINQAALTDTYLLPRVDKLFADLCHGKYTKLDMSKHTYNYPYVLIPRNINTLKGLFQYNWLPLGVSAAPAIFQRTMETPPWDVTGIFVDLDDILVTGPTVKNT